MNSWGQPSVVIVFIFDKIYDGNSVGITIVNIHQKTQALSFSEKALRTINNFP